MLICPISELSHRNIPLAIAMGLLCSFSSAVAVADDTKKTNREKEPTATAESQDLLGAGVRSSGEMPEWDAPDLTDPAFAKYVDISLLQKAAASFDAGLMTDLAIQLSIGEGILLRPHNKIPARLARSAAIAIAKQTGDVEALTRLVKHTKAIGDNDTAKEITGAMALVGKSRTPLSFELPKADVAKEHESFLKVVRDDMQHAIRIQSKSAAEELAEFVKDAELLKNGDEEKLLASIRAVASQLPQQESPATDVDSIISKLGGASRAVSQGPRYSTSKWYRIGNEHVRFDTKFLYGVSFSRNSLLGAARDLSRSRRTSANSNAWDDKWYYATLPDNVSRILLLVGTYRRADGEYYTSFVAIKNTQPRWLVMKNNGTIYYPKNDQKLRITWWPGGHRVDFDVLNPGSQGSFGPNDIWYSFGY